MIPRRNPLYIPFGPFSICEPLVTTTQFFPCLLTGPSGIGKTETIEELCARNERDFFRVNITYQTDEDDLIGGLRLEQGSTNFQKGPVITAMECGGVLLLDEIDLASPMLIMCLQSILEGKGYLIKKTGEWVSAKPSFQVFATANTKGAGDTTGSFVGTQVLNEAFLERFPITVECSYPDVKTEKLILTTLAKTCNINVKSEYISTLIAFANDIRSMYLNDAVSNTISTRRLVHIIRAFSIWKDEIKAVEYCMNRFDEHTKKAFMDIFELQYAENVSAKTQPISSGWEPW